MKQILVFAPHTDDAELGCGGTIAKHVEAGDQVYVVAFSSCDQSLPVGFDAGTLRGEMCTAMDILGVHHKWIADFDVREFPRDRQLILDTMIRRRDSIKPDVVYLPSKHDCHQDHRVIYEEGVRCFSKHVCSVFGYDMPWNSETFDATYVNKISSVHLAKKMIALSKYVSQQHRPAMAPEFIKALARVRGIRNGFEFAEAFEVIKLVS